MKWVGDNTYGMYLWHVPVQIAIILFFARFAVPSDVYLSPWFLISYLALVIGLARLSFVFFERPFRSFLNGRFSRQRI